MSDLATNHNRKNIVVKTVSVVLSAALTVFSLSGCGAGALPDSEIHSPVPVNYIVDNQLICQEHKEGSGAESDYSYITIDGLKDDKVEKTVNDRIKAVYDGLRAGGIPPYRGIKAKINGKFVLTKEQIYTSVAANYNNIFSVILTKNAYYQDPEQLGSSGKDPEYYDQSEYFTEEKTLNFDLNTGEEIQLRDLFSDDVDYMKLVNDYLSRYLNENHAEDEGYFPGASGELKLVQPFRGLSENQKFAVYPDGILFVFDYDTPQFETGDRSVDLLVYFSAFDGNMAVADRFFKDKGSIYTSQEPPSKSLVVKGNKNDNSGNEYHRQGNLNIYQTWRYSSELPEQVKHELEELRKPDQGYIDKIQKLFQGESEAEIKKSGGASYEIMVYGKQIGSYINIAKYSNTYLPQYSEQIAESRCFDSETLKELNFDDIFIEGYDYKPVIMAAIKKAVVDYDGNYADVSGKNYSDQQYEKVYSHISGFNLDSDAMTIPIDHPEKGSETYGLRVSIPYRDFGCENMTIFR
jgi:Protein of unknown function (DUF3298).